MTAHDLAARVRANIEATVAVNDRVLEVLAGPDAVRRAGRVRAAFRDVDLDQFSTRLVEAMDGVAITCDICADADHEVWQLLGQLYRCAACGPLGLGCLDWDECFPEGEG